MDAPARFKAVFLSDLHLSEELPETTRAFLSFLENEARQTERLYILGDLFQYWVGDDAMAGDAYLLRIVNAIKAVADSGTAVYWLCGNRDFLTGKKFLKATGATALEEPGLFTAGNTRIAFSHGDALCTDDEAYMKFRAKVRNPIWRFFFLLVPLSKRKSIATNARKDSAKSKMTKSAKIMDVNLDAVKDLFRKTNADVLIHGHTHRPGEHPIEMPDGIKRRIVLSDWDLDDPKMPRGDWLSVAADGAITRHAL
ncbi:MAG: UDP-2,3-diacylglucosamine diphosphatase [Oxalobacter sp.]|jgi:UDP-2,3-diacylglucosamine hydrolase|nr:UDP-2,3-diacylglucosamine diphosphatase [Oxalobacter sp.]